MPLSKAQLEQRLDWVESLIAKEKDEKNLPSLNATFQKLLEKLVVIDLAEEDEESQIACLIRCGLKRSRRGNAVSTMPNFTQYLGLMNPQHMAYRYADGSEIRPMADKWIGQWANGKIMKGETDEAEIFDTPEDALRCLWENDEGPFAKPTAEQCKTEKPNRDSPARPVTAGNIVYATGLTKREMIAAMAMEGLLASNGRSGIVAKAAIEQADALLEELAK